MVQDRAALTVVFDIR